MQLQITAQILRWLALGQLVLLIAVPAKAQYTLDEIGVLAGGGYASYFNDDAGLAGPAFNAAAFYGHYFCGKAYGIHVVAGLQGSLPTTANGVNMFLSNTGQKASLTRLQAEAGFYLKIKAHDYHRKKEWALLFGPKVRLPLLSRYASAGQTGPLKDELQSLPPVNGCFHLSLQFRRPADKKSWFIEPGVEFSPFSEFELQDAAGQARQLYLFLNLGFAFWDRRG